MSLAAALIQYAQSGGSNIRPVLNALAEQRRAAAPPGSPPPLPPAHAEARAKAWGGTTIPPLHQGGLPASRNPAVNRVLAAAQSQIGVPYVFGAEAPKRGFDCSGLIDWAYRQAGIDFPGRMTTYTARAIGHSVKGPLEPGDMLITNGGEHMVMYVGKGQVIAAPHTGEVVQYQPVSRFTGDIVDVRRVVG